uniref:Plastid-encoded RNA polymerase subunit alpha n=1 Tax=Trypanosoma congolense (strain IL3000) TaxID=1068625 RepID=G0UYR5_TRYCI|nr:unnamed protein product [Trypanosoma congolense IL3000]
MFRRLMITEVPVLAFDRVLIEENDGVVPDEVLCHRIGLIPLAGPVTWMKYITDSHSVTIDNLDPAHVLVFELDVEGQHGVQATSVYSGDLKWRPLRSQEEVAAKSEDNRVFLVHPDIVLTRLGPGQRLKLRAIAIKGIGVVHAKWSPVAACFYEIRHEAVRKEEETRPKRHSSRHLRHDADNEEAEDVDLGSPASARGANNVSTQKGREIVRFTVESVGQLSAADVFRHALRLFIERMRDLVSQVRLADPHMPGGSVV